MMKKTKNVVECKSLGIPLREDLAREVDALCKELPRELRTLRRKGAMPDSAELVKGERADISTVSAESVDSEGEVVLAKGLNLDTFRKNPVVMWAHDYSQPPVGKAQWIKCVDGGVKAKTVYSEATETSRAVWQLTQEGILKGKSVGFLPLKIRSATDAEIKSNPTWKSANAVIESGLLLEFSCCSLPVNQDALVEAVAKGLSDKRTLRLLGLSTGEPKKLTLKQIAEVIEREFARHAETLKPEAVRRAMMEKYRV